MIKEFKDKKYDIVEFKEKADIYVINSCSVTNMSTRKTRQHLSYAKGKGGIVVLVGCYAEEIKDDIDIKNVDIVLGNEEKKEIVKYVEEYIKLNKEFSNSKKYVIGDISKVNKYIQKSILNEGINIRESVKIEDGCNNFCTYCIIPYLRGRVRSRSLDDIVLEVNKLVNSGVKEIVLVGIEIASYGIDLNKSVNLVDAIEEISKINGVERIRLGSLEPRILSDENIIRLSKIDKLCPHFHLSIQNLDNNILRRMNRHYNYEYLECRIKLLNKYFKELALTCDVIVGFPGESDEEFEHTLTRIKKLGFYEVHVFKYSKRKYTKAAKMNNQVDGNIANSRSKLMIEQANILKAEYIKKYIGQTIPVLYESYNDGYLYGYTSNYIKVKAKGDKSLWGKILPTELYLQEKDVVLGNILN